MGLIDLSKVTDQPADTNLFRDLGDLTPLRLSSGQLLTLFGLAVKWDAKQDTGKSKGLKAWAARKANNALGRRNTGTPADLDAVAVGFDNRGEPSGIAYFGNLKTLEGGMLHTGDSVDGAEDGWDETITVNLAEAMMRRVKTVVFLLTAYKEGTTLGAVENVIFGVLGGPNKTDPVIGDKFAVTVNSRHRGIVMARLVQINGVWHGEAINAGVSFDNTAHDEKDAFCNAAKGYAITG